MPERFERELFDLIEAVSLRERAGGAGFVRHLARSLHAEFGTSLGLRAAAELRDRGEGFVPGFAVGAPLWDRVVPPPRDWAPGQLASLHWWVRAAAVAAHVPEVEPDHRSRWSPKERHALDSETDGEPTKGRRGGAVPHARRHVAAAQPLDLRLFPLDPARQHALGLLTLPAGADPRLAEERELRFQVLGQLIRLFVERHHHQARLEHIVALAREQQLSLLQPQPPPLPGYTAAALAVPAEEVGGDYHQVTPLSARETAVVVADAKGKGFEAAVLVTALHTALRVVQQTPFRVEHKVSLLNRALVEQGELRNLVSIFYGELNADGRLLYVNGSHPPALLIRESGTEGLSEGGLFLGLGGETEYRLGVCQLHPGDLLVLHTDGWDELFNQDREEFGAARLRAAVRECHGASPAEVIDRIQAACDAFRQDAPFHDDRTLLVVRRDGHP